eukprot:3474151-Pyramimonas_sp.AAC.1
MGAGDACGRGHWGLRWKLYGATKRVRGVPKWARTMKVTTTTATMAMMMTMGMVTMLTMMMVG